MTATDRVITPDDIRAKFDELQGDVDAGTESVRDLATTVGVAVAVAVVVVIFFVGIRRGRKRTTVVEIRRV